VRNLAECTKLGGYFIATSYDGKNVYNMLKNKAVGEGISIIDGGTKIWEVQKQYRSADLANDSSCLGYKIDVYQESINKLIPEFLVNYDYFTRVMENYGFQVIPRDEAVELGLPEGSGLFSDLYTSLTNDVAKNKSFAKEYKGALNMNANEKKISFLNRYVVYKKIRIVNAAKVILEEAEQVEVPQVEEVIELEIPAAVTEKKKRARKVKTAAADEASKPKPKGARKLATKLVIVEDVDTSASSNGSNPKTATTSTQKKKLVLQEGSDSD
jgi:hypothetical protein